jgi:CRISPR-associated protein Cmr1
MSYINITFECEVITPMFLAGADGITPELRPPSIKGALRFWWRALNGHLPLEELKKMEGEIFGSTEKQSKFKMSFIKKDFLTTTEKPLPHKERSFTKEAIRTKEVFQLTFRCQNEAIATIIKNLFPLCCVLGGFGGRARRGFGSVKITKPSDYPNSLEKIYILLNNLVPSRFILIDDKIIYKQTQKQDYPYIEEIEIGRANANLLRTIGQATHDINKKNGYDYGEAVGSANPRFSSPVYISALESNRGLQSVITTLHNPKIKKSYYDIQKELKKEIL